MGRGSGNIERAELLGELANGPRSELEIARALAFKPQSVRRRLQDLSRGRLVRHSRGDRHSWEWGPAAGYVLAGAVGSSRINAAVFDPYIRALSGGASRQSALELKGVDTPAIADVINALAQRMREALLQAGEEARKNIRAISFALPYGMDPDTGTLLSGPDHGDAREMLQQAMTDCDIDLPWDAISWTWASDVALEGLFEFHFGGAPQQGASPLLIVKLSRNIRCATLINGRPWRGARGDVADLGGLPTRIARERAGEPDTATELRQALSLEHLYKQMTGTELTPAKLREEERTTDADMFERIFRDVLQRRDERGDLARAAMFDAGEILGGCLDGPITALSPAVVVITGFLTRDEAQLKDGILSVCAHHRKAGVAFAQSSGIDAEVRGGVEDCERLSASPDAPLSPRDLPHQYRITAAAAKLATDDHLAPTLRRLASTSDRTKRQDPAAG